MRISADARVAIRKNQCAKQVLRFRPERRWPMQAKRSGFPGNQCARPDRFYPTRPGQARQRGWAACRRSRSVAAGPWTCLARQCSREQTRAQVCRRGGTFLDRRNDASRLCDSLECVGEVGAIIARVGSHMDSSVCGGNYLVPPFDAQSAGHPASCNFRLRGGIPIPKRL